MRLSSTDSKQYFDYHLANRRMIGPPLRLADHQNTIKRRSGQIAVLFRSHGPCIPNVGLGGWNCERIDHGALRTRDLRLQLGAIHTRKACSGLPTGQGPVAAEPATAVPIEPAAVPRQPAKAIEATRAVEMNSIRVNGISFMLKRIPLRTERSAYTGIIQHASGAHSPHQGGFRLPDGIRQPYRTDHGIRPMAPNRKRPPTHAGSLLSQ